MIIEYPAIRPCVEYSWADLYPEENDARVVVADAGLDAKQITFSSRAQTNWHNILAEAIRQARLDSLLKIALADYAANPALLAAYGQYRLLIDQGVPSKHLRHCLLKTRHKLKRGSPKLK